MKVILIKHSSGAMVPASEDEAEKLKSFKVGQAITCEIKKMRNYKYHQKFFVMIKIGFDCFEPAVTEYKGFPVQKNIDRFRKDIIIAAGFYDVEATIDGKVRAIAHSISFGKMSEERFNEVYNACCNAILSRVLQNYTREDLDHVVDQLIRF
jgi:hypothetical protein